MEVHKLQYTHRKVLGAFGSHTPFAPVLTAQSPLQECLGFFLSFSRGSEKFCAQSTIFICYINILSSTPTAAWFDEQKWWYVIESQALLGEPQWGFSTYSSLVLSRSAHESCHRGSKRSSPCTAVSGKMNCVCIEIHEGRLLQLIFLKSLFIYLVWRQRGWEQGGFLAVMPLKVLGAVFIFGDEKISKICIPQKSQFSLHFSNNKKLGKAAV